MTRGDTPPNPSELLMTPSLGEILDWASKHYDQVIVDSPPVLAVTDAVIVGQLCGIALMIARFSESAHKEDHNISQPSASKWCQPEGQHP